MDLEGRPLTVKMESGAVRLMTLEEVNTLVRKSLKRRGKSALSSPSPASSSSRSKLSAHLSEQRNDTQQTTKRSETSKRDNSDASFAVSTESEGRKVMSPEQINELVRNSMKRARQQAAAMQSATKLERAKSPGSARDTISVFEKMLNPSSQYDEKIMGTGPVGAVHRKFSWSSVEDSSSLDDDDSDIHSVGNKPKDRKNEKTAPRDAPESSTVAQSEGFDHGRMSTATVPSQILIEPPSGKVDYKAISGEEEVVSSRTAQLSPSRTRETITKSSDRQVKARKTENHIPHIARHLSRSSNRVLPEPEARDRSQLAQGLNPREQYDDEAMVEGQPLQCHPTQYVPSPETRSTATSPENVSEDKKASPQRPLSSDEIGGIVLMSMEKAQKNAREQIKGLLQASKLVDITPGDDSGGKQLISPGDIASIVRETMRKARESAEGEIRSLVQESMRHARESAHEEIRQIIHESMLRAREIARKEMSSVVLESFKQTLPSTAQSEAVQGDSLNQFPVTLPTRRDGLDSHQSSSGLQPRALLLSRSTSSEMKESLISAPSRCESLSHTASEGRPRGNDRPDLGNEEVAEITATTASVDQIPLVKLDVVSNCAAGLNEDYETKGRDPTGQIIVTSGRDDSPDDLVGMVVRSRLPTVDAGADSPELDRLNEPRQQLIELSIRPSLPDAAEVGDREATRPADQAGAGPYQASKADLAELDDLTPKQRKPADDDRRTPSIEREPSVTHVSFDLSEAVLIGDSATQAEMPIPASVLTGTPQNDARYYTQRSTPCDLSTHEVADVIEQEIVDSIKQFARQHDTPSSGGSQRSDRMQAKQDARSATPQPSAADTRSAQLTSHSAPKQRFSSITDELPLLEAPTLSTTLKHDVDGHLEKKKESARLLSRAALLAVKHKLNLLTGKEAPVPTPSHDELDQLVARANNEVSPPLVGRELGVPQAAEVNGNPGYHMADSGKNGGFVASTKFKSRLNVNDVSHSTDMNEMPNKPTSVGEVGDAVDPNSDAGSLVAEFTSDGVTSVQWEEKVPANSSEPMVILIKDQGMKHDSGWPPFRNADPLSALQTRLEPLESLSPRKRLAAMPDKPDNSLAATSPVSDVAVQQQPALKMPNLNIQARILQGGDITQGYSSPSTPREDTSPSPILNRLTTEGDDCPSGVATFQPVEPEPISPALAVSRTRSSTQDHVVSPTPRRADNSKPRMIDPALMNTSQAYKEELIAPDLRRQGPPTPVSQGPRPRIPTMNGNSPHLTKRRPQSVPLPETGSGNPWFPSEPVDPEPRLLAVDLNRTPVHSRTSSLQKLEPTGKPVSAQVASYAQGLSTGEQSTAISRRTLNEMRHDEAEVAEEAVITDEFLASIASRKGAKITASELRQLLAKSSAPPPPPQTKPLRPKQRKHRRPPPPAQKKDSTRFCFNFMDLWNELQSVDEGDDQGYDREEYEEDENTAGSRTWNSNSVSSNTFDEHSEEGSMTYTEGATDAGTAFTDLDDVKANRMTFSFSPRRNDTNNSSLEDEEEEEEDEGDQMLGKWFDKLVP